MPAPLFGVTLDDRGVAQVLTKFAGTILPHVTALALNFTAEDASAAIRGAIPHEFIIRDNGKRIPALAAPVQLPTGFRASDRRLSAVLQPIGTGLILDPFEHGRPKVAKSDARQVALPTPSLRTTPTTVIPSSMYPANLGLVPKKDPQGKAYYALGRNAIRKKLTPFHAQASGAVLVQGKRRSFILDPSYQPGVSPKQAGVYIRVGPKPGDVRRIWTFRAEVKRPSSLHYREIALLTFNARWAINLAGALQVVGNYPGNHPR